MPAQCIAVGQGDVSCTARGGLIRIPGAGTQDYHAPTCPDAEKDNPLHWHTVSASKMQEYRKLVIASLGRGSEQLTAPRACKEHFTLVNGEHRPWQDCLWRDPDTNRWKLVYHVPGGFAKPVFCPPAPTDPSPAPQPQCMTTRSMSAGLLGADTEEPLMSQAQGSASFVRSQAAATKVEPEPITPTQYDRQSNKRKKLADEESKQAVAAEAQRRQDVESASVTFDTLKKAPLDVLNSMTGFRSWNSLEAFYNYLDALGELTEGTYIRYRWGDTHVAHFHEEDGSIPGWVGDGISDASQAELDAIRRRANEPGAAADPEPGAAVEPEHAEGTAKRDARGARKSDVFVPEPAPRVAPQDYKETKHRTQPPHVSGRQSLLMTLMVLCGGLHLNMAAWLCGVPAAQASSVFITMIMFTFWTFKRDFPFPSQKRCRKRCPKHYAEVSGVASLSAVPCPLACHFILLHANSTCCGS